jgi:hypothetical protein
MINKSNIRIQNKDTKKIRYKLYLDDGWWSKKEYDTRGNKIYYENSVGYSNKYEYDSEGKQIYFESNKTIIRDGRKK